MALYLRDDFKAALGAGALRAAGVGDVAHAAPAEVFEALFGITGDVYRQARRRRTLRFVAAGSAYFAKLHDGIGWREIFKNLLALKRPVVSARNEMSACRQLQANGVHAPTVAAFGEMGRNPAARRSFVICDALDGFVSLEDIGNAWHTKPPPLALKRRLLTAAGELTRAMHAAGVCHRDYYVGHLMANAQQLAGDEVALAVIDLHRADVRRRVPERWRRRDLAALLYSCAALPLTRQDRCRFVAAYTGEPAARALRRAPRFWRGVQRRSRLLHDRAIAKGVANGAFTAAEENVTTIERFADLGRDPPLPLRFDLDLGDGGKRAVCTTTLRSLPGRRYVAKALVEGREVVLKAFFGVRRQRDFIRERSGAKALQSAGVPTPRLLGAGRGAGALVLAFECLDGRQPMARDLAPLMNTLAHLHEHGVRQHDLHVDNFLISAGRAFAIDGAAVRTGHVGRADRVRDIARLLAEFNLDETPPVDVAAKAYGHACDWRFRADELRLLGRSLVRARRRRAAEFMAKTTRDCTPFVVRREAGRTIVLGRGDDDPALAAIIADPERALASGTPLKRGNTATVMRVGNLVVKRYNIKSRWHAWRLRTRPLRARRAWRVGHALRLLGLATAAPRALIENRAKVPGAAAAYLVHDYLEGPLLSHALGPDADVAAQLRAILARWRELGFSHGDMKASNFVLAEGVLHVLDLDAGTFHRYGRRFASRHRRDLARLHRNWPDGADI